MSYPEDYTAPFAGDQTGQILAEPDMVALSPVTSARVVETQSGFLMIVKRADDRLSLSVKRRIGTPPCSQVLLTGDESLNLSRVLQDSANHLSGGTQDFIARTTEANIKKMPDDLHTIYGDNDEGESALNWDEITQPLRKRRAKNAGEADQNETSMQAKIWRLVSAHPMRIAIGASVVLGLAAIVAGGLLIGSLSTSKSKTPLAVAGASAEHSRAERIDKFVRTFVAQMLNFDPKSYKQSQVRAMAVMKPELMERYWKETSFPLSKARLQSLPANQNVVIDKVVQQPTSSIATDIDLYAELVSPGQTSNPLHLAIEIEEDSDGSLVVSEMKDASNPKNAQQN